MDLKGAEIRNVNSLCSKFGSKENISLNVNIPYYQRPYKWGKENIKNLNIEFTKKVARKIAMRMMANGDDWQYISDVINISINELEVYQWFIDRWNKQEITSKN